MHAYIFQAALICSECAAVVNAQSLASGVPYEEVATDSDRLPQGPYSDGGGEADCPQYCDHCGMFLKNPLTTDGYKYLWSLVEAGNINDIAHTLWKPFYLDGRF